jgi:uncharacterized protein YhjY with autotransporter beta-barrel domain
MYRRNKTSGSWVLKASTGHGEYWTRAIALADDDEDSEGKTVLTFHQAQDAAKKLAHGGNGSTDTAPVTVDGALKDYRRDLEARGANPYNAEHPRLHLTSVLLSKPVALLTAAELKKWRDSLLGTMKLLAGIVVPWRAVALSQQRRIVGAALGGSSQHRHQLHGDHLTANFDAQSYGGRLEGGYRFAMPYSGITPYAALQAQSFHTPFYAESDGITDGFGLVFPSRDATDTRSELGARFDRAFAVSPNAALALRGRLAWAHDWVSDPTLMPLFQALPGASFIVNGAVPAEDSALTSAGAELRFANGITVLAKFDGEFASHSSTYAGTGTICYSW